MESLKMKTFSVCNNGTNLYEPAYKSVSCNAVEFRQWKFTANPSPEQLLH